MGVNGAPKPVRVGIIGAGAVAAEHARAFGDIAGVEIVGVHSRSRDRAQQLAERYGVSVYDSVRDLHEATQADLVLVAVPVLAIAPVALACFDFPWTIFVEKTPGHDVAEAAGLAKAARHRQRRVYVGLNRNFLSSTQAVLNDVAGRSGARHIQILDQQSRTAVAAGGHPAEVVRDWMFANSIHLLDYVRLFARGTLVSVETPLPWDDLCPTTVLAVMRFDSGDTAVYEAIWNGPGPWAVSITTSERRWELRPLECARYQDAGMRDAVSVAGDEWDRTFKPGFRRQAEEIIHAVRGESTSSPTLEQALSTMNLIHTIYRGGGDR